MKKYRIACVMKESNNIPWIYNIHAG